MNARESVLSILTAAALATIASAQQTQPQRAAAEPPQIDFDKVQVRSFKVQDKVYMLVGAGGNVTVQIGDEGVLIVDTQFAQMADKLQAEIRRLAGNKTIRYVINTHVHGDHTGGNAAMRAAGEAIIAGNQAAERSGERGADLIAHENVSLRLARPGGNQPAVPFATLPTETYLDTDEVFFNGEAVQLFHQPAAHTDGDTIVFFRKSDVISAGDIYTTTSYPFIDRERGGYINGIIAGLNHIIELAVPRDKQEGGTMVIPGHGRISDEADVVEYRDMLTIIRDRIQDDVKKGMTLEQVKASKPTRDYDGRYGSTTGFFTTDMFVEAVYRGLSEPPPAARR
jgi:glyoxylase-like metal-dependent hydrolase (beta-lactamase superfamily II)